MGDAAEGIDITVLSTDHRLTPERSLPLVASSEGIAYGQTAFFLGFPYGINAIYLNKEEGGYPVPLVKQCLVSAFCQAGFFLDGHNNPGFSGGPVVFRGHPSSSLMVASVISAFRFDKQDVHGRSGEIIGHYKYNTGIIVSYDICHAVSVIQGNPIGYAL